MVNEITVAFVGRASPDQLLGVETIHPGCSTDFYSATISPSWAQKAAIDGPDLVPAVHGAAGAAGAVGTMVTQLAREYGAYIIGTGRAADRQKALDFGAQEFVDLQNDSLDDVGGVDLVFDVIGGDIQKRSADLIRAGGTPVSVVGPPEARPADGLPVDFVVEADRAQLSEVVRRVRDRRPRTNIGNVSTLDDAADALDTTERTTGKTIICVAASMRGEVLRRSSN